MNKKSDNKIAQQQNILEILQNQIQFLRIFSQEQLKYFYTKHQIIVFSRGTILAKEGQIVDYLAVLLQGTAIFAQSKTKISKGNILGNSITNGLQGQKHCQDIVGETDGVILAIRIQNLLSMENEFLKKKIISFIAEYNLCQMKSKYHQTTNLAQEFQIVDSKSLQKLIQQSTILSSLFELFDLKEKNKFLQMYPVYGCKQKTLVISKNNRPYILILIKGQLISKSGQGLKKESKIIQSGHFHNVQGFIFDHTEYSNIYCLSSQATFIIVDKRSFIQNFKFLTLNSFYKQCLDNQLKANESYAKINEKKIVQLGKDNKSKDEQWSPFKKSNYKIQELPKLPQKKAQVKKQVQKKNLTGNNSLATYQSLYKTYFSIKNNKKQKTKQTLFTEQDVGQKLVSLKTEQDEQNLHETDFTNKIKKLEAQLIAIKQSNKALTDTIKGFKLDALQSKSKLNMTAVFKQIKMLQNYKTGANKQYQDQKLDQTKILTLKQAFQDHLKKKKLQVLVAKCAFKWLSITRRNKRQKKTSVNSVSHTSLSL